MDDLVFRGEWTASAQDELRQAVGVVMDGDLLREMTRHNAAEFANAVAVLARFARRALDGEEPRGEKR